MSRAFYAKRTDPAKVRIIWHGRRPARKVLTQTRAELAELLDTGLGKPADLVFHTVFLNDDDFEAGPIVSCWGQRGSRSFHAEVVDSPKWTTLSETAAQ